MLISNEYDEVITMCNFITRWNIIPKKKKKKKRKEAKTSWKFEKKKNWNFFWENLVTKLVVI